MKQNKWSIFKSRMGIYLNETHGLATRQPSTMASFCGDDEILINYSSLIKNMNYIDCTRFNTDDIKCASSPRVSTISKRCQPHKKAQKLNVKVGIVAYALFRRVFLFSISFLFLSDFFVVEIP